MKPNNTDYIDAISIAFFKSIGEYIGYSRNNISDIDKLIVLANKYMDKYKDTIDSIKTDDKELTKLFTSDNSIINHFIPYKTKDGVYVEYEEDCSIKGSSHERRLIRDIRSIPIDNYNDGILNICISRCNSLINIATQFMNLMIYLRCRYNNEDTCSYSNDYLQGLFNNIYRADY